MESSKSLHSALCLEVPVLSSISASPFSSLRITNMQCTGTMPGQERPKASLHMVVQHSSDPWTWSSIHLEGKALEATCMWPVKLQCINTKGTVVLSSINGARICD